MAITLKADIPQDVPFAPVSPVTMPTAWEYSIPDSMAAGTPPADVAEFEFTARPGQVGSISANVAVPGGRSNVTVAPYLEADADGSTYRWGYAQQAASETGATVVADFPEFPEGTTKARLGFELREPAAGTILRTNLHPDPRCTSSTNWKARNSWTLSAETSGSNIGGITGLNTFVRSGVASGTGTTGITRGFDIYNATDAATPTAGNGLPVTAGTTVTLSAWVRVAKNQTMVAKVRFFTGTTWSAAETASSAVSVTANVWTRVSVTATVPAGATYVCGQLGTATSSTWALGEYVDASAVLLEVAGSAGTYFDGETADAGTTAYHWAGTANASVSEAYDTTSTTTVYRTNLIPNPSFETNTTGWAASYNDNGATSVAPTVSLTRQVTGGAVSSCFGRVTVTSEGTPTGEVVQLHLSPSARTLLVEGQTYTLSAYVRSSVGRTFNYYANAYSASSGGSATYLAGGGSVRSGSGWHRISTTFTVPVGKPYLEFKLYAEIAPWVDPGCFPVGSTFDVDGVLLEKLSTVGSYFDGSFDTEADYSSRWTGTAHASTSELYAGGGTPAEPGRKLVVSGLTMAAQASAEEIIGANLTRPLRRSVFDALNEEAPQIAVGTPGLLAGSITYLCSSFEDALALDSIYQFAGRITLTTGAGVALDGFTHMAVDQLRLDAEKAVPGKPAKWLVRAEVREIEE